jgi:hypothetical protein
MKKNYSLLILALLINSIISSAQTSFAGWNFNTSSLSPSSGTGTLTFVGGCGSPTYVNNAGTQALAFADFPLVNAASGTAGIQFSSSTVGYAGISVTFDTYGHNQSSRWQQYQYTIDGTNWLILGNNNGGLTSSFLPVTLNFPATCDNNPNFAFRVVSIFNPSGGTQYEQVQGGGYNGSNGKWYFDNVGVRYNTLSTQSNSIDGLTMYPNPLKGNTLYFTSTANADMSVQIYDVLGKEVTNSKVMNNTINVSGLNTGVYIVKVTEEGKTATRKLVIQ